MEYDESVKLRIINMLKLAMVKYTEEKEKLESLIRNKKWNPYCLRHSSISNDSDYLPDYALKKKVRWSMNCKQGIRYIKKRMGNDLNKSYWNIMELCQPKY